jgi:hypothetical protein
VESYPAFLRWLILGLWALPWALGGCLLVQRAFRLRLAECAALGLASGWLLQGVLSNLLAHVLALPAAAWGAALVTLLAGALAARPQSWRLPWRSGVWVVLAGIWSVGFVFARGLAIYDDYAHLPALSLIAAGDFPLHFAYDPQIPYGYHHFLLLLAAQIMRLAHWYPWSALDAARALSLALGVVLGGLWAYRVVGRPLAALAGGAAVAFFGGARWLLLILPPPLLDSLSAAVTLIGSGRGSGETLAQALPHPWPIEGAGPLPFPFAFTNGIFQPGVLTLNAVTGLMPLVVIFALLLTASRWQHGGVAAMLSTAYLAAGHLIGETDLPFGLAAWGLVTLVWVLRQRTCRLPPGLRRWWLVVLGAALLALIQGGTWTELVERQALHLLGKSLPPSYQTIGFAVTWVPALVSAHLGVLPLIRPATLLVALLEAGPVLAVWPLVLSWGWKALRSQHWYEAALAAVALVSLPMLLVRFTGSTGVRNTARLYAFVNVCLVFAVPGAWLWVARHGTWLRGLVFSLAATAAFGGLVLFRIEFAAVGRPVASSDLTGLDVRMFRAYWNRLEPDALVFDPRPSRAPTLFGRFTRAGDTWSHFYPEWTALANALNPQSVRAAGFAYAYLDAATWRQLTPQLQQAWRTPCVRSIDVMENIEGDFRWLVDVGNC